MTPAKEPVLPSMISLLHEFVERQARSIPDKVALEWVTNIGQDSLSREQWTYAQLDDEGNKVAHLLLAQGAIPGCMIGVCFDKCPEASFAILGALKAGCSYVALDPSAPIARKAFVIKDSGATIVLTMKKQGADLHDISECRVICMDDSDSYKAMPISPVEIARAIDPQDTCYCLYTSGIVVPHAFG